MRCNMCPKTIFLRFGRVVFRGGDRTCPLSVSA
uniref:Uncharacterized protein n=1 Tax=Anguilla anguilla TaxID=7936 RepID=A0A0E9PDC0_ANGAN